MESLEYTKIPSYNDVSAEIKKFAFYGFANTIGIAPLVRMERDSKIVSNLDSLLGKDKDPDDTLRKFQVNGASFQKHLISLLKTFDKNGVLDV